MKVRYFLDIGFLHYWSFILWFMQNYINLKKNNVINVGDIII